MSKPIIIRTWFALKVWHLVGENVELPYLESNQRILEKEDLKKEYEDYKNLWAVAKNNKILVNTFVGRLNRFEGIEIRYCLILGLGLFATQTLIPKAGTEDAGGDDKTALPQPDDDKGTHHRICNPSMHQLVFIDKLLSLLKVVHGELKHVYIQDPEFSQEIPAKSGSQKSKMRPELHFAAYRLNWEIKNAVHGQPGQPAHIDTALKYFEKEAGGFLFCPQLDYQTISTYLKKNKPNLYIGPPLEAFDKVSTLEWEPIERELKVFNAISKARPFPDINDESWPARTQIRWLIDGKEKKK